MSMKKMKKMFYNHMPAFAKPKKCFWKHPAVIAGMIVIGAALLATVVIGLVKWAKREEDLLDEDWLLDDEDDSEVFLFPNEDNFTIDED